MIRRRLARASRKDMGGDSLGDGPYGIALIYRADCNLNQAHGAQFAAWAARVAAYERFGVRTYWIVNPGPPEPELTVFELRDGRYALAAKASGPFTADHPFPVTIDLAGLTRGLRR
jgi:hypothetical protein